MLNTFACQNKKQEQILHKAKPEAVTQSKRYDF